MTPTFSIIAPKPWEIYDLSEHGWSTLFGNKARMRVYLETKYAEVVLLTSGHGPAVQAY